MFHVHVHVTHCVLLCFARFVSRFLIHKRLRGSFSRFWSQSCSYACVRVKVGGGDLMSSDGRPCGGTDPDCLSVAPRVYVCICIRDPCGRVLRLADAPPDSSQCFILIGPYDKGSRRHRHFAFSEGGVKFRPRNPYFVLGSDGP